MNYLLIGIAVFMLAMIVAGMYNGLVRCIVGTVAYIISAAVSLIITLICSGVVGKNNLTNVICFVVAFVVVYIALIVAGISMNLITTLPVISTLNRICGAIAAALLGFLGVLLFMAIVSMLARQGQAKAIVEMINNSELLKTLYENNIVEVQLERFL